MEQLVEFSNEFMEIEKGWYESAKKVDTQAKLNNFTKKLMNGYKHDAGTYLRAITCVVWATIHLYGKNMAMGGGDFLMWNIIRQVFGKSDRIALKLTEFEWLLDPRTLYKCEMRITKETHNRIIEIAKVNLIQQGDKVPTPLREHWEKIVDGWLPSFVIVEKGAKA